MILAENELVPYKISDIPEGPWLTFAPHADDETFGMGGVLNTTRPLSLSDAAAIGTLPNVEAVCR